MLSGNPRDLDFRKRLAVAILDPVAFATFLFENDDLVILEVVKNGGCDKGSLHEWGADSHISLVVHEQDLAQFNGGAFFLCHSIDKDFLTLFNLELAALDVDDSVHGFSFLLTDGKDRYSISIFPRNYEKYSSSSSTFYNPISS